MVGGLDDQADPGGRDGAGSGTERRSTVAVLLAQVIAAPAAWVTQAEPFQVWTSREVMPWPWPKWVARTPWEVTVGRPSY
ncbi:hypothetical protein ACFFV7_45505 [Nonomuraea spiralis]|uniref:Uncharacterized protein n=1 Tax=Nonomuraea spiralis TaxID=46182 RepID=A0ABV5IVA4_9ACTN|nr:hypothetical protein [Nonomuraea spiralis]GGS83037.1 hypothetical protein GCM10010176_028200 [Nonomuraea spiralis]